MALPESINATIQLLCTVREVLADADVPGAAEDSNKTITHSNWNFSDTLNANSDPEADVLVVQEVTIGGSPTDIDLTAAPLGVGRTADLTGKKLVGGLLKTKSTNAGAVTVGVSGANDYELWGASKDLVIAKGRTIALADAEEQYAAVGASDKIIRISGTNGDTLYLLMVFGTQS